MFCESGLGSASRSSYTVKELLAQDLRSQASLSIYIIPTSSSTVQGLGTEALRNLKFDADARLPPEPRRGFLSSIAQYI